VKVLLFVALWLVTGAQAQELTFLGGNTKSDEPRERSFGWALSYSHELSPHFSASLTYQNEGHLPGHHRDGFAAQLWATGLTNAKARRPASMEARGLA
jgi:hypothetical protein